MCGFMGGIICWNLVKNGGYFRLINGIVFLGLFKDLNFLLLGGLLWNVLIYMG